MNQHFANPAEWQTIVENILSLAQQQGASSAEVSASVSDGFSVSVRLGEVETVEYHRDKGVDITVYFGQQQGTSSTTEVHPDALKNAVTAACSIAKATGSDPCHGLADSALLAYQYPDLDLYHHWDIDVNQGIALTKACEEYGRAYDKRITNSEGASLSAYQSLHIYANSHHFVGQYFTSQHSLNCALLAEIGGEKQRDYDYTAARDPQALVAAQVVGETAAQKTLARLQARKLSTRQTPVIFAAPVARGVIGHFIAAIRGGNLYRRSSFLLDHLHQAVFPNHITIIEQPHLPKALGSAPFDGEGVATRERTVVKNGILQNYALDSYAARKLGLQTTGNAGGVHNLLIQPTTGDLDALIQQMHTGLLITEVMGQGVNIVTGDYSRGVAGFWVEGGEIQYPVHEITAAGNLKTMLMGIQAAGNDIDRRGNICSGSLLIDNMTIAGE